MKINVDCRFFRGDIPCAPHKRKGVHCEGCPQYDAVDKRILIIKLGAIGDVIRTTPLLRKLKQVYPKSEISWLTLSPEVVPSLVDRVLRFELKSVVSLLSDEFDILYNLDKDKEAIAMAKMISAREKAGFGAHEITGKCSPFNDHAYHKWLTGLFDDVNRANTKSYPQEIFEMCGFQFNGEEYILEVPDRNWQINEPQPLIGLNTGCGSRWPTRLWKKDNWIKLSKALKQKGYGVILLGGPDEDSLNKGVARESGASYLGFFTIPDFISLMNECDMIVTGVTMALHIAIGLKKKLLLFNNIFNRNEFELYGLGDFLEPDKDCKGCFKSECNEKCMDLIKPDQVLKNIESIVNGRVAGLAR